MPDMNIRSIIEDMERAIAGTAPWVGIAAVKQWIACLENLEAEQRRDEEGCQCVSCRVMEKL